jgi:hypothetical protein
MAKSRKNVGSFTPSGIFIPCMAADEMYIRLNGHLMAYERASAGVSHVMMCGECGRLPLDLIYSHSPCTEQELLKGNFRECECGKVHGKIHPGMIWGDDITPICPCCSFAHCTHKQTGVANAI